MSDLLIELNVALWGFIVPMFGIFRLVTLTRGGPRDPRGRYVSTMMAMVLLLTTAVFSHFIFSPVVRKIIESLCLANPYMGWFLPLFAVVFIWFMVKKSRRR